MIYDVTIDGRNYRLEFTRGDTGWLCQLDGREVQIDAAMLRPDVLSILIGGKSYEIKRESSASDVHLWVGPDRYAVEVRDPRSLRGRQAKGAGDKGPQKLVALMPGKVVRLLVAEKAEVASRSGCSRGGSDEDAERNQVTQEGNPREDGSQ